MATTAKYFIFQVVIAVSPNISCIVANIVSCASDFDSEGLYGRTLLIYDQRCPQSYSWSRQRCLCLTCWSLQIGSGDLKILLWLHFEFCWPQEAPPGWWSWLRSWSLSSGGHFCSPRPTTSPERSWASLPTNCRHSPCINTHFAQAAPPPFAQISL